MEGGGGWGGRGVVKRRGTLWVFFFKQKTAYEMCGRDWSSDVCSSDLPPSLSFPPSPSLSLPLPPSPHLIIYTILFLELQLKPNHSPLVLFHKWSLYVKKYTMVEKRSLNEPPQVHLRRNVYIDREEDLKVRLSYL